MMSIGLKQKIESLSPQEQKEVENFVEYLQYKSLAADALLTDSEESEIHMRLTAMRQSSDASVSSVTVFSDLRAKYGR